MSVMVSRLSLVRGDGLRSLLAFFEGVKVTCAFFAFLGKACFGSNF